MIKRCNTLEVTNENPLKPSNMSGKIEKSAKSLKCTGLIPAKQSQRNTPAY